MKNQFAIYEDLQVENSADQVEIKNLSPGSTYTFRFNVQMGPMSGPSVLLKVFIIFVFIYFTSIFIQILLEKYLKTTHESLIQYDQVKCGPILSILRKNPSLMQTDQLSLMQIDQLYLGF